MFVAAGEASWQLESVYIILGIVIIIVGSLVAWLGSFTLYGFGELIERATSIDKKLAAQNSLLNKLHISTPAVPATHSNPQPIQKEQSNRPSHPAIEQPATKPEPVVKEAPPTVESKPVNAYNESELQILKSLLQEGKLSEEEYQNCLSNLQK
jgi:hypothetical protein